MTQSKSRAEDISEEALGLSEEERPGFIERACAGDLELLAQVEALVTEATWEVGPAPDLGEPKRIGRYEILERLGEGGMGIVYAALEREPIQRRVAVKVIKHGLDTKEVLARFEAERQALAVMNHESIAKVFDAGKTADGRPYFVMEYVNGESLTKFCDRFQLDTRDRLRLFVSICKGVEHAHQRALIHRDLKPSNILVELVGDEPVPKIIDFGVAKSTRQSLTERTLYTQIGSVVGTPAYMSPEQAEISMLDVDTRSDVYSLGVVLYELLTGFLPFDPEALRTKAFAEIQRIIREEDPPKPSTRLSTSLDESSQSANLRQSDAAALVRLLRGDLDQIVMKCLEKVPARRYGTAAELSLDLASFLEGRPVQATPPTFAYRALKFARRNRTALFSGVVIVASLVGVLTWALIERGEARAFADRAASARRRALADAATEAQAQEEAEAERRAALAQAKLEQEARAKAKETAAAEAKARAEANRLRNLAAERAEKILRLADIHRLREAVRDAASLWPAYPDKIDALDRWLSDQAEPLAARLPEHESKLESLRRKALPYSDADARRDREEHPLQIELTKLKNEIALNRVRLKEYQQLAVKPAVGTPSPAASQPTDLPQPDSQPAEPKATKRPKARSYSEYLTKKFMRLAERVAEIEEKIRERRTWRFNDTEEQWQHDILTELVAGLTQFVATDAHRGTLANVRTRLAFARQVESRSIVSPKRQQEWDAVRTRIAASTHYQGSQNHPLYDLKPQLGLVPLGPDPKSGLEEFLHLQSHYGELPKRNSEALIPPGENLGLIFVLLPGGTFHMGAQKSDPSRPNYDELAKRFEHPVHEVTLRPFLISKYEMTQAQWLRFTGQNPSMYDPEYVFEHQQNRAWNPVEMVNWREASRVARQLGLDLPTESQWEYAARAGTSTPWWCGQEANSIKAKSAGNLADRRMRDLGINSISESWEDYWLYHAPVGSFRPNPFGLHDTIGNLWEWCRGSKKDYSNRILDLEGQREGLPDTDVVVRGGSFWGINQYARSAWRQTHSINAQYEDIGLRPIRRFDHEADPASNSR